MQALNYRDTFVPRGLRLVELEGGKEGHGRPRAEMSKEAGVNLD